MRVSWYTASKPWFTDWDSRAANSWLLKIFKLQPGEKKRASLSASSRAARGGDGVTWRDLADGGRVPAVALVAVGRLDEDGRVAEALGEHLAADVVEPDALADVAARLLDDRVAVHVREQAEAEALRVARVREPVHGDGRLRRVERLADARVQLVVADGAPERRLAVHHRLGVDRRARRHAADVRCSRTNRRINSTGRETRATRAY